MPLALSAREVCSGGFDGWKGRWCKGMGWAVITGAGFIRSFSTVGCSSMGLLFWGHGFRWMVRRGCCADGLLDGLWDGRCRLGCGRMAAETSFLLGYIALW